MPERPRYELYDLKTDPWEQTNLAGQEAFSSIEQELKGRLVSWMKETSDPLLNGPIQSIYNREILAGIQ
jgi:hypothetical protein